MGLFPVIRKKSIMENGIPEHIVMLVLASCERALTQEERESIEAWLKENPDDEICLCRLRQYAATGRQIRTFESIDIRKGWERVGAQTSSLRDGKRRRLRRIYQWSAAAAAVLLCAAIGVWYGQTEPSGVAGDKLTEYAMQPGTYGAVWELPDGQQIVLSEKERSDLRGKDGDVVGVDSANTLLVQGNRPEARTRLRIPRGGEYRVVLADGTRVWVNSESELAFPLRFGDRERVVEIKGEAYFEVAKDSARPFLVKTPRTTVRVLGTSFNVCGYEGDTQEQTTLVSGAVEVDWQGKHYRLEPGEQLEVEPGGKEAEIRKVKTNLYTSWKDGMFRFADMPLDELTVKLARWYHVRFEFIDEECKKSRFSGAIRKDVDFYRFIDLIETTTHVDFEVDGDRILIKKRR